jgi:hypothetical protein
MIRIIGLLVTVVYCCIATANTERYSSIAAKYQEHALASDTVANAVMQGECLVQLKELTFKKKNDFDPISEWVNYRSTSLLEQYSPCETLIILEIANKQLRDATK